MSPEGLIIAIILTAIVVIFVVLPLAGAKKRSGDVDPLAEKQRERLLVYYERVLRNIHDLDEDHALGKLADAEYEQEREVWAARGVQVLKALDSLADQQAAPAMIAPTEAEDAAVDHAIDDAIEAAVRKARRDKQMQTESVVE
jgi:cytochrome c-type biogenesis protein CcmI